MRTYKLTFLVLVLGFFISCGSPVERKPLQGCLKIEGTPGPEDIELAVLDKKPFLIVSSHNRRNMESIGTLFSVDLSTDAKSAKVIPLQANYPANFRPHGISYAKVGGKDTLAVISHTLRETNPHTLEIFERDKKGSWVHTKTLEDESLTSPNDLFLTESGEIFVSNDAGSGGNFRRYWDVLIRSARSDISYYNGKKFKSLNEPVLLGNGILVRKENGSERLYRSVFADDALSVYEIKRESDGHPNLKLLKKIPLASGPDNIIQDEKGDLWVAAHKSTYLFLRHASNAKNISPTQVFRIDGKTNDVYEIYADNGEEISAGSTGLPFNGRLYISQVFEDFLLSCSKP
ncbi:arylesterase [Leptospira idonii]|uniref:Arylesterase n=1 Tax=Leptospira idonii TaxID=1193500 RepID=A0A4R9LTN1_9LEPT|nr:arylesterase [Leptospira idonii]TGN17076.1 arylesterase [Leptospira idonii]